MNRVTRHLLSLVSMAFCGGAVLYGVYWMNAENQPPPKETKVPVAEFNVQKKKPPKPKKRERTRERKPVKTPSAPPVSAPNLVSAISGVSFDLPGFASADFGRLSERLIGDTSKQTAMTADVVDDPPKPRRRVQDPYPDNARQRGLTGYVTLKIKIGTNGSVETVRVVDASPRGVFEENAISSIKKWEFAPGMYQGNPVEVWASQTLRYELN